jgi:hypothetical protein
MKPFRDSIVLVALSALSACAQGGGPDSSATPSEPIFRYVELNIGRVHLGEQLPASVRAAAAVAPGDTIVSLGRGSFAGAERITLHLNADGVLRGAVFDYATRIDFEGLIREYESLGAPTRSQAQRQGEEPSDIVSWQDTLSTFRLRRDPNRSAWTVRVELWDRALTERVR